MRRKEKRSKQGHTNNKAKQHSTPKAVTFPKNELPRVGLEPTTLYTLDMYIHTAVDTCCTCCKHTHAVYTPPLFRAVKTVSIFSTALHSLGLTEHHDHRAPTSGTSSQRWAAVFTSEERYIMLLSRSTLLTIRPTCTGSYTVT